MKKKLIIILSFIILLIVLLISLYFYGLTPVSKNGKEVEFKVTSGTSKMNIVNDLKDAGLIKSKFALYIYVGLHHNINLQAGNYILNTAMSAQDIMKMFHEGKIKEEKNTFTYTFVEGKRIPYYASKIADAAKVSTEEVMNILSDQTYLKELINKYWFLTDDILNESIYYPLEGYLFASTYDLYNGSSVKDIVIRMLDGTDQILSEYKNEIEDSKLSVHELLTLASIVELEGSTSDDRAGVAGVFYNRLNSGWSLGSDATTYYGAKVDFSERDLWQYEIEQVNAYNTRTSAMAGKLPIGPICSPSKESIKATIEPEKHDYYFFVADKNKKTYFTKTNAEHESMITKLKSEGLWYQYR